MKENAYDLLKQQYMNEIGFNVPKIYQSQFVHWGGGVDAAKIYEHMLKGVKKGGSVLLVGVMGGRDYFLCKNLGYTVTAVDLGPQPEIEDIVYANVEEPMQFEDSSFEAVVMGEVIEHLGKDIAGLAELRRVLSPEGRLIISVPYYNDWEEGHLRIHSPITIQRLLAAAGFEIEEVIDRPGLVWSSVAAKVIHGLAYISSKITGRTSYAPMCQLIGRLEIFLGKKTSLRMVRKFTRRYGSYIKCKKSADRSNYIELNRGLYTNV